MEEGLFLDFYLRYLHASTDNNIQSSNLASTSIANVLPPDEYTASRYIQISNIMISSNNNNNNNNHRSRS